MVYMLVELFLYILGGEFILEDTTNSNCTSVFWIITNQCTFYKEIASPKISFCTAAFMMSQQDYRENKSIAMPVALLATTRDIYPCCSHSPTYK